MELRINVSFKDLIIFILILCVLTLGVFIYRQVVVNTKNISAIAVATGLVKPQQPQTQPKGDGK